MEWRSTGRAGKSGLSSSWNNFWCSVVAGMAIDWLIDESLNWCAGASGATFTFENSCHFTVWVGLQPNGGIPLLADGGFELASGKKKAVSAPQSWGGRFWGRTGA